MDKKTRLTSAELAKLPKMQNLLKLARTDNTKFFKELSKLLRGADRMGYERRREERRFDREIADEG